MNARQQRFVQEYLIDLNATQAAIRAGYSARTAEAQGSRLLRNVKIAAAVTEAQANRARRVEVSADYVLTNLTEVVERCMQRAPVMVREGREMVQETDDDGRHVWQFDSRGVVGALTLVGKHLAMFTDRHEVSTPAGTGVLAVPVVDQEAWLAIAKKQQADLAAAAAAAVPGDAPT